MKKGSFSYYFLINIFILSLIIGFIGTLLHFRNQINAFWEGIPNGIQLIIICILPILLVAAALAQIFAETHYTNQKRCEYDET